MKNTHIRCKGWDRVGIQGTEEGEQGLQDRRRASPRWDTPARSGQPEAAWSTRTFGKSQRRWKSQETTPPNEEQDMAAGSRVIMLLMESTHKLTLNPVFPQKVSPSTNAKWCCQPLPDPGQYISRAHKNTHFPSWDIIPLLATDIGATAVIKPPRQWVKRLHNFPTSKLKVFKVPQKTLS